MVNAGSLFFKLTQAPICDKPTMGFHQHLYDYICYKTEPPAKIVILPKGNSPPLLCGPRIFELLKSSIWIIKKWSSIVIISFPYYLFIPLCQFDRVLRFLLRQGFCLTVCVLL